MIMGKHSETALILKQIISHMLLFSVYIAAQRCRSAVWDYFTQPAPVKVVDNTCRVLVWEEQLLNELFLNLLLKYFMYQINS